MMRSIRICLTVSGCPATLGLFLIAAPEAELDTTERLVLALGQGAVPLAGVEPDAIVEALNTLPGNARFAEQWGSTTAARPAAPRTPTSTRRKPGTIAEAAARSWSG